MTPEQRSRYVTKLRSYAGVFNAISRPDPNARPTYDLLGDMIYWPDEIPQDVEAAWLVKPMLHHRTRVMLGLPSEFGDFWDMAIDLFPSWIGLGRERCSPSSDVLAYARRELENSRREIERVCVVLKQFLSGEEM